VSSEAAGINRQGCEVDHLTPSRAGDTNESKALYPLHLYAFLVWKGTTLPLLCHLNKETTLSVNAERETRMEYKDLGKIMK
jgi:hypothetical protein